MFMRGVLLEFIRQDGPGYQSAASRGTARCRCKTEGPDLHRNNLK
jgi:hypothetical protein